MKIKNVILTLGVAAAMGFVVFAGLSAGKVEAKEAKATTYSGTVFLQLNTSDWKSNTTSVGVYFFDDEATPNHAWGPRLNPDGSTTYYKYDYSGFSFQPTKCIVSRFYKDSQALSDWMIDWDNGGVYARTTDVTLDDVIWLGDYYESSKSVHFGTYTLETHVVDGASFDVELSTYSISDGHLEASGSVTFSTATSFYLYPKCDGDAPGAYVTKYGRPDALKNILSGGNGSAISCSVPGTYNFFFKFLDTKEVWISRQDIVDADGFATYFLEHVGCDETGVNEPTGWNLCKTAYEAITNGDAKDYLCSATASIAEGADNIAKCVYWYDRAIIQHPSLTKFMVDSHDVARASYNAYQLTPIAETTNVAVIIVIAASVSLLALGGFFFIKRKKESK